MKNALLLLLFVAGAVVAFFVALRTGDDLPIYEEILVDEANAPEAESGVEDLASDGGEGSAPWTGSAIPEGLDFGERVAVAGAEGDPGKPLEIQVWAGRVGVPAVGAEVFFAEVAGRGNRNGNQRGRGRGWGRNNGVSEHWSVLPIRDGERFVANAAGRVKLPPVGQWAMVTARRPGEYGFLVVRQRHKPVETIMLGRDESLTVRVVDGAGKGVAGVPVGVHQEIPIKPRLTSSRNRTKLVQLQRALVAQANSGDPATRSRVMEELKRLQARARADASKAKQVAAQPLPTSLDLRVRSTTDQDGTAIIEHFQLYRHQPQKWWRGEHTDKFQASLLVPMLEPVFARFEGRPTPSAPIELAMPPMGSITVRVLDHDGRSFSHPANAELRVQAAGVAAWTRIPSRKEQDGEAIVFPWVGLGLNVRPHVWLDDRDFRWDGPVVAGPGREGQRVTIDVTAPAAFGILRGRLIDAEGKALKGIRPTFLITGREGRLEGEDLSLDPEGRFQLMFEVGKRHQPPFSLEIRQQNMQPPRGMVMRLPGLEDGKTVDLGDVVIDAFGAFVRGTVLDDARRPVVGSVVKLQRERLVGRKTPKPQWRDEAFVTARTDESGRFELFGDPLPGRYRVEATARNHFTVRSREVFRGSNIDLRLERTASLVGTLLMPKWLPSRSVKIRVESALDSKFRRDEQARTFGGKNLIYVARIRPGIYNVIIRVAGFSDPILRIDGVRLEAGQRGAHPRLTNLNLLSSLYRYQISAVDENGQSIKGPAGPLLAQVTRMDGKSEFVGFPWNGNKIEVFSASPQMEVVQIHTGYRVQRAVVTHGVSQLRFVKLPPVRLVMPGARAAVGPDIVVRVSMVLTANTGLPTSLSVRDQRSGRRRSYSRAQLSKSGGAWLRETDEVMVSLMKEGEYQVVLRLRGTGVASVPVVLGNVNVAFRPGVQPVVQIAVDLAKVKAGLAQVQKLIFLRDQKKQEGKGTAGRKGRSGRGSRSGRRR